MSTVYIWRPVLGFAYETKFVDKPPSNDSTHFTAREWLFKPLRPHSVSIKHDPTTETAGLVMFVEFGRKESDLMIIIIIIRIFAHLPPLTLQYTVLLSMGSCILN